MLDDGCVYDELILRRCVFALGRLGDEALQDGGDDGVVPVLRGRVFVGGGGAYGFVAGIVADLLEALDGNGLFKHCGLSGCLHGEGW